MYRNFLLDNGFWASKQSQDTDKPTMYMKHDETIGGIYAKIVHRGVKIVANNEARFFNNFDNLEGYLERLYLQARNPDNSESNFFRVLNRRHQSNILRKLPL